MIAHTPYTHTGLSPLESDLSFLLQLTTAIASEGASPIIRVPWGEEWMIKRALDAGAHGVMVPMCHNAVSFPLSPFSLLPIGTSQDFAHVRNCVHL